uniref:Uncharacterized protein n=1 Tax=Oryza sativa subsp. japonica TaxID=39947 RepID=Q10SM4_ORYSJ|nr:hypothetical protein LOC_Os03g02620 [Oryza sativa Japonica Group]
MADDGDWRRRRRQQLAAAVAGDGDCRWRRRQQLRCLLASGQLLAACWWRATAVCGGGGSGDGCRECGGGGDVDGGEEVGCEARMATARWLGVSAAAAAVVVTVSAVTGDMTASDG